MTTRLGGRPYKDAEITDNFNHEKIQKEIPFRARNLLKARTAKAQKIRQQEEDQDQETKPAPTPAPSVKNHNPKDDVAQAYQMLQDLRHAYRNALGPNGTRGRTRLLELMKTDPEFKSMVKELIKVETSLVAASIRKQGDGPTGGAGTQNFFVVLKGLEEEKNMLPCGQKDKTVDLKQIRDAIDPDRAPECQGETIETDRNALPQQLTRAFESV